MEVAFDARVRVHSSFARVMTLLEAGAERVGLSVSRWSGGPCTAEVLWSTRQADLPPVRGPLRVATLHDLNPLLPDGRPRWRRLHREFRFRSRARRVCHRAWRIATDSEHVRAQLERTFPGSRGRCAVVPLYAAPVFRPEGGPSPLAEPGYLLYVGALRRHKNWEGLLAAYALLPASLRRRHPLLLVGRARRAAKRLPLLLEGLGLQERVRVLEELPEDELPGLYRGASLFLFPSLLEGFGLPPLEAMACGTPVIASDRASLPEVLGDGARLVDPSVPSALAAAVEELLGDEGAASALRDRGLARAATYGPERSGAAMRALLQGSPSGSSAQ